MSAPVRNRPLFARGISGLGERLQAPSTASRQYLGRAGRPVAAQAIIPIGSVGRSQRTSCGRLRVRSADCRAARRSTRLPVLGRRGRSSSGASVRPALIKTIACRSTGKQGTYARIQATLTAKE